METVPEQVSLTEHFSFAEVTWKIKNFSLVLCPLTVDITSEEFQIENRNENTEWRMKLNISHEKNNAILQLRMMGPDRQFYSMKDREAGLKVNCYANILDSNGEQSIKYERTFYFTYRDCRDIETFALTDILSNLPHIGPDDLIIRCFILVDHAEYVNVPAQVPLGLIELSTTMEKLINKPLHPDIQVNVNNKILYLNRDMFSNIKSMGKFMDMRYKEAKLLNHCEYSIYSILLYAYSGNINYILNSPRIRVAEDIERLNVPDLLGAYPKEKVKLLTTRHEEKHSIVWTIEDFELMEKPLDYPEFDVAGTGTSWKVSIYPRGKINGNVQGKKYVFLEVTLLKSERSIDVNIEFCSLCVNENTYTRRNHGRMNVGDKLEVPYFRRDGLLMKKCLINGNLSLRITLWIATGQTTSIVESVVHPHPFRLTNTVSMTYFAKKMKYMLGLSPTWDLCLYSDNKSFKVHKFVVASRCAWFKNRMSNVYRQTLLLPNYKGHCIRVFLENLYTGLYCDMEFESDCHMYEFGFYFDVNLLKDRFEREVDFPNLLRVFEYANDNNLQFLLKAAFNHFVNFGEVITTHPEWNDFFNRNTELAYKIISTWE